MESSAEPGFCIVGTEHIGKEVSDGLIKMLYQFSRCCLWQENSLPP